MAVTILSVLFLGVFFPVYCYCAGEVKEGCMTTTVLPETTMREIEQRWPASSQLIIARDDGVFPQAVSIYTFERKGDGWQALSGPVPAMAGRNGFASAADKREGDGRTPKGVYRLGFVFGYGDSINSRMHYKQMTPEDIWVDDPDSPDYNRLTKRGMTAARSSEDMVLSDDRYKYGIVVEYNTDPVVAGAGSAIFIHVWKDGNTPTSGCVALSEENILKLTGWLDPAKNPLISIGN